MDEKEIKAELYLGELLRWNKTINLVSRKDLLHLYERHYLDSLAPLPYLNKNKTLLDIGSGNGFPSIPLSIMREDLEISSMESNFKKAVFLEHMKGLLKLKNYSVLRQKAVRDAFQPLKKYDYVISRAFSNIQSFVEIAVGYLNINGKIIYFNTLLNNELQAGLVVGSKVINSIDSIVYKSGDNTTRSLTIIGF